MALFPPWVVPGKQAVARWRAGGRSRIGRGEPQSAGREAIEELRRTMGLDKPIPVQLVRYKPEETVLIERGELVARTEVYFDRATLL